MSDRHRSSIDCNWWTDEVSLRPAQGRHARVGRTMILGILIGRLFLITGLM